MKKQVFIHVGPPKTGTSAIQKWLCRNQSTLNENGIFYPTHEVDVNGVSSGNVRSIYNIKPGRQLQLSEKRLNKLLSEFQQSDFRILLLSSEFFFRRMDELKKFIPEANFIAYVRNPLELKESSYNQSVKRHFQTEKLSFTRSKRLPQMVRLTEFVEKYTAECLHIRLYGEQYFKSGSIVSDLLSVVGIDLNVSLPIVNGSYQFEALEFKRWFNQFEFKSHQSSIDRVLQGYDEGNGLYSLFPAQKYIEDSRYYADMLEKYSESLNIGSMDSLISNMRSVEPKQYVKQQLSETQFVSVCRYLESKLQTDYYLLTQEVSVISPRKDVHLHSLFVDSSRVKYRYLLRLIAFGNRVKRLVNRAKNIVR